MPPRLVDLGRDPRFQRGADGALAAALLAGSLVGVAVSSPEWSGSVPTEIAVAVACSVPLAWRRTHPVPAAILAAIAANLAGALVAPTQGPFTVFVAYTVALYSLGVHASSRAGIGTIAAVTLAGLGTWAVVAVRVDGSYYGDWIPALVWGVATWTIGRVIRSRNRRTRQLERLTAELEAEREARAREAVTVERARIARELHDVVAHNVSVMGVQAAAARRVLDGDQPDVRRALEAIESTGRETVDEMRRMLGVLRSDGDELGLAPQPSLRELDALVEQVRSAGLDVHLRVEGTPFPLPAGLDLSAYRILQEGLTNALKHAAPARVDVAVRYAERVVEIEISDDGAGADRGSVGGGHGLVGMRERVALFGGELRAGRRTEGGWSLRAVLPVGAA